MVPWWAATKTPVTSLLSWMVSMAVALVPVNTAAHGSHLVQRAYDNWAAVSGLTFVYESFDDGAPQGGSNRGIQGVRGDVRVGGAAVDGDFGILAYNYFPSNGGNSGFDGDMVLDTSDAFYALNSDGPSGENRALTQRIDARSWPRYWSWSRRPCQPNQVNGAIPFDRILRSAA
jgi:hypothetical protein